MVARDGRVSTLALEELHPTGGEWICVWPAGSQVLGALGGLPVLGDIY